MGFEFYRLKNGVRVVLAPMEGVESVATGVFVETGSRYETSRINGISHFLEHMVFKGTAKFPTHKETSYLEGLGAIQNAWTDVDATAYWCKIPADRWREGLEMAKELALYPTIPASDLEIERGVILEEINRREDRPDELVSEELQGLMFAGNPLEKTVLGTPTTIKSVSREDFVQYHRRQYVAGRLVVVMAGKLASGVQRLASRQIEKWFGELPSEKGEDFEKFAEKQEKWGLRVLKKDLANQAHIELAFRGLSVGDPRRFAAAVMTAYLGQGLSSRLFLELREKRGLCYAVHASEERMPDTGVWSVYAGLNVEKLEEAIKGILSELERIKHIELGEKEVSEAREKVRGPLLFSAESPINQMNWYGKQALDRPEEILTYNEVVDRVMQIDVKDVQKVAEDIFLRKKINLAIVGPVDKKRQEGLLKLLEV